ncbi:MAG: protein kinase [bacterium]|nr:protein kinase [bacterium]
MAKLAAVSDDTDQNRPARVGPYRLRERLGVGGMGEVYRAYDERLDRWVAIKHILPEKLTSSRAWQRLRREARAAARLNHPAIVRIYDLVQTNEGDWIVMELVEGRNLDRVLREDPLRLGQALHLAREIAEGLAEAHAQGIVHRDLKTENIMVTEEGHARILDFGLAKRLQPGSDDSVISVQGTIVGTGRAMSPEQARGEALDHRSDLFSLGSLLFEMFAGQTPFRGDNLIQVAARICSYQPPSMRAVNRKVPKEMSVLIDRLLEKSPALRPQSAAEVVATLASIAGTTISEAGDPNLLESVDLSALGRSPGRSAWGSTGITTRTTATGIFVKTLVCAELVGPSRARELVSLHDRRVRALMGPFAVIEALVDHGLLLLFERPVEAVCFAQAYHDQLSELSEEVGVELRARVGIHLGDVFIRENAREQVPRGAMPVEVEGLAKLVAARVMSLARGGQTLLTWAAYDISRCVLLGGGSPAGKLRGKAHGRVRLEGIEENVRIFEIVRRGNQGTNNVESPGVVADRR